MTNYKETWTSLLCGQDDHIATISHYVDVFRMGLSQPDKPVGVFLLAGPTGVGKTHTVTTLAQALHGNPKNVLRINCTEFPMEHDVAKLIGAPPGYLGHKDTVPQINQQSLNAVTSKSSNLSIVLLDEIEKAANSLQRLILNALDTAVLKLGDNTTVNFENSLIFMTTNLGAVSKVQSAPGFVPMTRDEKGAARVATSKFFSPEFKNRIDETLVYSQLSDEALLNIINLELYHFNRLVIDRRGLLNYRLELTDNAKSVILKKAETDRFGARELKRLLHKYCTIFLKTSNQPAQFETVLTLDMVDDKLQVVAETVQDHIPTKSAKTKKMLAKQQAGVVK